MFTIPSHCLCIFAKRFGLRRSCAVVAFLLLATMWAGTAPAQDWGPNDLAVARNWNVDSPSLDWARGERESARTSALHNIAMIQASNGDVQGAKQTVRQMVNGPKPGWSEVTVVWTCNGQPIYDHPPKPSGANSIVWQGFLTREQAADRVPSEVPPGLPSTYLAADPRHGALVDFTDGHDSRGTRVTSRKYADGHIVIETPHAAGS
jgi:hypothetical protein